MSRDRLCEIVENIKDKITSQEYREFMDELATMIPAGEKYILDIIYTDSSYEVENYQTCDSCDDGTDHERVTLYTHIKNMEVIVKSEDFDDSEQYDIFKKIAATCNTKHRTIRTISFLQTIPEWQSNIISRCLYKTLAKDLLTENETIRIRISSDEYISADDDNEECDCYEEEMPQQS